MPHFVCQILQEDALLNEDVFIVTAGGKRTLRDEATILLTSTSPTHCCMTSATFHGLRQLLTVSKWCRSRCEERPPRSAPTCMRDLCSYV